MNRNMSVLLLVIFLIWLYFYSTSFDKKLIQNGVYGKGEVTGCIYTRGSNLKYIFDGKEYLRTVGILNDKINMFTNRFFPFCISKKIKVIKLF